MFKNRKGFTLLELLVVVLIIGILAGIALPQYKMAVGKSKFATLKDNARVIKDAMDRYFLTNNNYTNNFTMLDIELKGTLSENKHRVSLPNNSECYISLENLWYGIFCVTNIFGIRTEYAFYKSGQRWCNAASQKQDTANRLCQQETGKVTGTKLNDGSWTKYSY